jgi:hypothetical protein
MSHTQGKDTRKALLDTGHVIDVDRSKTKVVKGVAGHDFMMNRGAMANPSPTGHRIVRRNISAQVG